MKGVTCFVIVFSMFYSTIVIMVSSVRNTFGLSAGGGMDGQRHIHQRVSIRHREKLFYQNHVKGLRALLKSKDGTKNSHAHDIVLDWLPIVDDFDIHQLPTHNETTTDNIHYDLVGSNNLCALVKAYNEYRSSVVAEPKPHVAWWQDTTPATTIMHHKNGKADDDKDVTVAEWLEQGCTLQDIKMYLDHPETMAVMITHNSSSVQALNHPKLQPLSPIGLWQQQSNDTARALLLEALEVLPHPGSSNYNINRTTFLLLTDESVDQPRLESMYTVLQQKFPSHYKINTIVSPWQQQPSNNSTKTTLWEPLLNSQFVLFLTKHSYNLEAWVSMALLLGAIPIMQENSWYQFVLQGLPVIWVPHYNQLDPELLQLEWEGILAQPGHYQYQRLTQSYWVHKAVIKAAVTST